MRKLPSADRNRVQKALAGLSSEPRPHGSAKLKGSPYYRVRVGDYRIIYRVSDKELTVMIMAVGHRKNVYGK